MTQNKIHPLTDAGYNLLIDVARNSPNLFFEPSLSQITSKFFEVAEERNEKNLFNFEKFWVPLFPLDHLSNDVVPGNKLDADHTRYIRNALPTITPADMSDRRVLASICCFNLVGYINTRWSLSKHFRSSSRADQIKFVESHWMGNIGNIKISNAAARIWWLGEFAARASKFSNNSFDELLEIMAENARLYDQMSDRLFMASDKIRAMILDIMIDKGISEAKDIDFIMTQLNKMAGGISLDILSKEDLKEKVTAALPPK